METSSPEEAESQLLICENNTGEKLNPLYDSLKLVLKFFCPSVKILKESVERLNPELQTFSWKTRKN